MHTVLNGVILYMLLGLLADILSIMWLLVDIAWYILKMQCVDKFISGELKQKLLERVENLSTRDRIAELVLWPVYQPIHCVQFHKILWSIEM